MQEECAPITPCQIHLFLLLSLSPKPYPSHIQLPEESPLLELFKRGFTKCAHLISPAESHHLIPKIKHKFPLVVCSTTRLPRYVQGPGAWSSVPRFPQVQPGHAQRPACALQRAVGLSGTDQRTPHALRAHLSSPSRVSPVHPRILLVRFCSAL